MTKKRKGRNLGKKKRKKRKGKKVNFLVPSFATGRTSAGGAIGLSPPCLVFELAARPVDTTKVEEAGHKFKIEGAGVTINHITVLGMRHILPACAAQLMVCLDSPNSNLYKAVSKVGVTHSKKLLCMDTESNHTGAADSTDVKNRAEAKHGHIITAALDVITGMGAGSRRINGCVLERVWPDAEVGSAGLVQLFLTSPFQALTPRSEGQGGSGGGRDAIYTHGRELQRGKQGQKPMKIAQPLHVKLIAKIS